MPKKKYFLTQAELAKLLKNYGGGYRWTHDKKLSQSGNVTYTDAQNNMRLPLISYGIKIQINRM